MRIDWDPSMRGRVNTRPNVSAKCQSKKSSMRPSMRGRVNTRPNVSTMIASVQPPCSFNEGPS